MIKKLNKEWKVICDETQLYRTRFTSMSLVAEEIIREILRLNDIPDQKKFGDNIFKLTKLAQSKGSALSFYADRSIKRFLLDFKAIRNDELHYSKEDEERNFPDFLAYSYRQTLDYLNHYFELKYPSDLKHYDSGKENQLSSYLEDLVSSSNGVNRKAKDLGFVNYAKKHWIVALTLTIAIVSIIFWITLQNQSLEEPKLDMSEIKKPESRFENADTLVSKAPKSISDQTGNQLNMGDNNSIEGDITIGDQKNN